MINFIKRAGEKAQPPEHYRQWVTNAQLVHGAVFAYLEALILLAALQYAAIETGAWVLWALLGAAFIIHLALTGTYVRAWIMLLALRIRLSGPQRNLTLFLAGSLGLALNFTLVWVIGGVIDSIMSSGLAD